MSQGPACLRRHFTSENREQRFGLGFTISRTVYCVDVDSTRRTGGSRGRRGQRDCRANANVLRRPSLQRWASRAPTDRGSRPRVSVPLVRMRLIDSDLEFVPQGSFIRDGVADRALGKRHSVLLVQPLSERIQKRYRVPLPDHAPWPGGRSIARVGRIDRSQSIERRSSARWALPRSLCVFPCGKQLPELTGSQGR